MARIASATLRPCETNTSTCRSLATISSGVCPFFFAISVLLRLEAIPQDGPLQWGTITRRRPRVGGQDPRKRAGGERRRAWRGREKRSAYCHEGEGVGSGAAALAIPRRLSSDAGSHVREKVLRT